MNVRPRLGGDSERVGVKGSFSQVHNRFTDPYTDVKHCLFCRIGFAEELLETFGFSPNPMAKKRGFAKA